MRLGGVIWIKQVVEKLWWKHHITTDEVEESLRMSLDSSFRKEEM